MILLNENLINPFSIEKQNGNILLELYKKEIAGGCYQIVPQYIYLTDYINKHLDDKAIELINYIFSQAKSEGVKLLVKFVYKYGNNIPDPEIEKVKQHMWQLKPILVIHFSLVVLVAGASNTVVVTKMSKSSKSTVYFMPDNRKITMRYKFNRDMLINSLSPLRLVTIYISVLIMITISWMRINMLLAMTLPGGSAVMRKLYI
ncbi:MAG TPA: DUF4874 domain-containing protein [Arsenophonus sp.]